MEMEIALGSISTPTYISSGAGSSQGTLTVNETATCGARDCN